MHPDVVKESREVVVIDVRPRIAPEEVQEAAWSPSIDGSKATAGG